MPDKPQPEQHTTELDEILEQFQLRSRRYNQIGNQGWTDDRTETAQAISALINHKVEEATVYFRADTAEAELNGRLIQAEADLDKWRGVPNFGAYTTYLRGQIEAHKYELSKSTKAKQSKESNR